MTKIQASFSVLAVSIFAVTMLYIFRYDDSQVADPGPYMTEVYSLVCEILREESETSVDEAMHRALEDIREEGFGRAVDRRRITWYYEPLRDPWLSEAENRENQLLLVALPNTRSQSVQYCAAASRSGRMLRISIDEFRDHESSMNVMRDTPRQPL